jgi:hypothetical protein
VHIRLCPHESKLYQHVIADMHGVCQAYVCKLFKKHKVRVKEQRVFTQGEPVRFHVGWQVEILKNGVHFGYIVLPSRSSQTRWV